MWCVFSPLSLSLSLREQDKTAEGADFSLLNWHTLESSHALYGNKKARVWWMVTLENCVIACIPTKMKLEGDKVVFLVSLGC